jgi:hypothetical protein
MNSSELLDLCRRGLTLAEQLSSPMPMTGISRTRYIPMPVVEQMAELGVFGLTIRRSSAATASARWPCAWCPRS